jgi:hypothetical protein
MFMPKVSQAIGNEFAKDQMEKAAAAASRNITG